MRFLTPRVHGILDYVFAITLIVTPFILGFVNTNIFALCISLVLGIVLLSYSLITDYTYSLFGAVSFKIHLIFDAVTGLGLMSMPYLFGFSGTANAYYVAMGLGLVMVVALSGPSTGKKSKKGRPAGPTSLKLRFLTPKIHSMMDYAAVVVLVTAPFLLGFAKANVAALSISLLMGIVLLGYSLITDYAYSLSGAISFKIHLVFDALSGFGAIAVPFAFGFDGIAKSYYIAMGVGVLIVVALTDSGTSSESQPEAVPESLDLDA